MKNLITVVFLFFLSIVYAQKSEGPYLTITEGNAQIPLKASSTDVQITGTIAFVTTRQVYQNLGADPIEAIYAFPLSTQSAIHKMRMVVGGRVSIAKIFEKEEAKKVYDKAIEEGKRAAKLDQHRPNVFQMKVGNIMPGDEVVIEIEHTEMLSPKNGRYEFVVPAVVGPRYTGNNSQGEEVFNTPITPKGIPATFQFDLSIQINAGMLIQNVQSPSHMVNVEYPNGKTARVHLSKSNLNPSNRDFILNYSLRGNEIEGGILLYEHGDENFFAFQMEPMQAPTMEDIPSREYVFVVDVSGSMNGYPLDVTKTLMRNLLCGLRITDTFNVQLFASSSQLFSAHSVEANTQNIEAAIQFLSSSQGSGGTELLSALKTAYGLPRQDDSTSKSIVLITDGYINVEKESFEMVRNHLDEVNVFPFGIGSSVNRYLIEGVARVSNSEPFIATSFEEARTVAEAFSDYISTPLLSHIKMDAKGFEMYDVLPNSIPDVFMNRPITIYGKYRGEPKGSIKITGYLGKKRVKKEYKISRANLSTDHEALRYLWARNKIALLDDYVKIYYQEEKDALVKLSLQYNLLTQYTSFVAVDEAIVNKDGSLKSVKQPIPLAAGLENSAVGAAADFKGKSKVKPDFKLSIQGMLTRSEKRSISMRLRFSYTDCFKTYLQQYERIRLKFDSHGKMVSVEALVNGQWILKTEVMEALLKQDARKLEVYKKVNVVVSK